MEFAHKKNLIEKTEVSVRKKWSFIRDIYNIFFTFDGHTLFIIGFMFVSNDLTRIIYAYLILLCAKTIITPLRYLITNSRQEKK